MRISDWSSDVCSSDLYGRVRAPSLELDDDLIGGEAVARFGGDRLDHAVAFGAQDILHLHRLDDAEFLAGLDLPARSEEHTSELQSLMRISYAVFCLKKKKKTMTTDASKPYIITARS